ncbi:MAG TPA: hypothetical protein VJ464_19215 [Blastocatellia bacterium]|nr:hypothetical protein [Blastocatellia bacterium]
MSRRQADQGEHRLDKKIGDAAWEDRIALCPVTVLTTVTDNREQEVMLPSPVSLAPHTPEQSRCHGGPALIPVMISNKTAQIVLFVGAAVGRQTYDACKKYIFWVEIFSCLTSPACRAEQEFAV